MTASTALDVLGSAKYISLTTYRKDGTAVATPVWLVRSGDALIVITDSNSGKAKRVRTNPAVLVSPCDMRGRVKPGAVSATGLARIQDDEETAASVDAIIRKYGLMGRILTRMNERKARKSQSADGGHLGLTISLDETG
jgi:hypothetical protein